MNDNNPVYLQAAADYFPGLVSVRHDVIEAMARPPELGAMGPVLGNSRMSDRPLLFTAYFIAMNVLNYQFWSRSDTGELVRYQHQGQVGALAMQAAFQRCWESYIPADAFEPRAVACAVRGIRNELEVHGVQGLLGDIPRAGSRLELLDEVLNVPRLLTAAEFLVSRVLGEDQLGWGDAALLAYLFPKSYADPYLKKSQLTLMFLASQWRAMNKGHQVQLDVSAAADYQLPKVLRALNVLDYSDAVARRVDSAELFEEDHDFERALRAATVHACDALANRFGAGIEAVDFWLWQQRNAAKDRPFHLCATTRY